MSHTYKPSVNELTLSCSLIAPQELRSLLAPANTGKSVKVGT